MYGRFCLAARDYPWASLSVERDQLWDYWAMQWAHPAGTCAAYAMHEIEVQVFGRRKWR